MVHYMNLQTYLSLGMRLVKVHRVLAFTQSPFLKSYVDFVTELRVNAQNEFAKALWKLYINAVFGKFIEASRNYLNVRLCNRDDICATLIGSPRFSNMKIISENLVAVFLKQATVNLNKAYPIGFTILERSKDFMFSQFYNVIRPRLQDGGADVQVIFSDTDSFGLAIKSSRADADHFQQLSEIFDFSNYPTTSPKYSREHASELGFWKDELQGDKMKEFVGLRSKTYAYLLKENVLRSKCKGVTKAYKKTIDFQRFKDCIETFSKTVLQQYHIRSTNHVVKTLKVQKTCFSSFDDKRYLMPCGIHSVQIGRAHV